MTEPEAVERKTAAPPSSSPVPLIALQQSRQRRDPEEVNEQRRRLALMSVGMAVLGVSLCAVAMLYPGIEGDPADMDQTSLEKQPTAPHCLEVTVPVPELPLGTAERDVLRAARKAALLDVAAHESAPQRLVLLTLVPSVADELLAGELALDDERFIDEPEDERRRFHAAVDREAVREVLCDRFNENRFDQGVDVALTDADPQEAVAASVSAKLAQELKGACVHAVTERPKHGARRWLVEGSIRRASDGLSGIIRLRDPKLRQTELTVPASAASTVDDVVRMWRDALVTKALGQVVSPTTLVLTVEGATKDTDVVFSLADALRKKPLVASVDDPTFITGGSAILHLTTFAPRERAVDSIDQMTVWPAPPVRLEIYEVQDEMTRLRGRFLPR